LRSDRRPIQVERAQRGPKALALLAHQVLRRGVIDPAALAGREAFLDRIDVLVAEMMRDEGVRLPGARRAALLRAAEKNGIGVSADVLASLAR
jgi:LDH2 family malate/lactate/ureidoglycolate dehydrogenase